MAASPVKTYGSTALVAGVMGLAILCLYLFVPSIPQFRGVVLYIAVGFFSVCIATVLVGILKGTAKYEAKGSGIVLVLGGSAAIFFLFVWGASGWVTPPKPPEPAATFDLTVRAHRADGKQLMIPSGHVMLELGNARETVNFDASGEANFKGISSLFKGAKVKFYPSVKGYRQDFQEVMLNGNVVDLVLQPEPASAAATVIFTGSLTPAPGPGHVARITTEDQRGEGRADQSGRFKFRMKGRNGEVVRVIVYVDDQVAYDNTETLPGPVELRLHNVLR